MVGHTCPACCCHNYSLHKYCIEILLHVRPCSRHWEYSKEENNVLAFMEVTCQRTGYAGALFRNFQWFFFAHFSSIKSNFLLKSNRATACCSQTMCALASLWLLELFLSLVCFSVPLKSANLTHSGLNFSTIAVSWPASSSHWLMFVLNQLFKISLLPLHPPGV